jgi:hypothetical protein
MTRKNSFVVPLLLLVLALLAPLSTACAAGDTANAASEIKAAGVLSIKGDCRILTDPNGRKFALVGKLDAVDGEQIRVVGKKAEKTKCLAGPAIKVEKIEKVKISMTKPEGSNAEPQVKIVTHEATGSVANVPMTDGEVRRLRMMGTLNDEVKAKKCQGFRNLRGELWALTGDLKTFKTGDKVQLEGLQAPSTECGAPTLKVTTIETFQQ